MSILELFCDSLPAGWEAVIVADTGTVRPLQMQLTPERKQDGLRADKQRLPASQLHVSQEPY